MGVVGLSECDLAGIDQTVQATFDRVMTVLRETRASDDIGGQTVTWPEVAGDVPCRIIRSDLRYVQQGDRVSTVTDTRIVCPRETDVQMGDKLVIDTMEFRVEAMPFLGPTSLTLNVGLWRP
jgi:Phage head-tail joining protein